MNHGTYPKTWHYCGTFLCKWTWQHNNTSRTKHTYMFFFGHDAMVLLLTNKVATVWYHGTATKFLGGSFKYHSNRLKKSLMFFWCHGISMVLFWVPRKYHSACQYHLIPWYFHMYMTGFYTFTLPWYTVHGNNSTILYMNSQEI